MPRGRSATFDEADAAFLAESGAVVVKPARGEQGQGITVGVRTPEDLTAALGLAQRFCSQVLLEEVVTGDDLRVLVIDRQVVAAAVRRPARVVGNGPTHGRRTDRGAEPPPVERDGRRVPDPAGRHDRSRSSRRPATPSTTSCRTDEVLTVRKTANLHTGGTIHDVTADLHPDLAAAAELAAEALDIPVVGMDFMVPAVDGPDYHVIEANERPGLANHEPQPTAQRFVDLLFPATRPLPQAWDPTAWNGKRSTKGGDHRV